VGSLQRAGIREKKSGWERREFVFCPRKKKDERKVGACECGGASVGIYSLSVLDVDGSSVKHYRIRQLSDGGCYISPRQRCTSIEQLVQHYSGEFVPLYTYSIAPRLLQSL